LRFQFVDPTSSNEQRNRDVTSAAQTFFSLIQREGGEQPSAPSSVVKLATARAAVKRGERIGTLTYERGGRHEHGQRLGVGRLSPPFADPGHAMRRCLQKI